MKPLSTTYQQLTFLKLQNLFFTRKAKRWTNRGDEPGSLQIHTGNEDPEWKNHVG